MRNVIRLPKPPSLGTFASQWTSELLSKIAEVEQTEEEVPEKYYNKYKKGDVIDVLNRMYNGICCYCESQIGLAGFPHIEHRKPKKVFPENTFEWDNLHLACSRCNGYKGNKYSMEYPILDAVKDQISEHMKYSLTKKGIKWYPITHRGETTERDTKLNEDLLRNKRNEIFFEAMSLIDEINEDLNAPGVKSTQEELQAMTNDAYGSVIAYAMEKFMK